MARGPSEDNLAGVMQDLLSDVRQALRALRAGGGNSVVSVLALAVGIGANTAVFSVADAVLLRPLPFREPDRLVMVWETKPAQSLLRERPSPGNFLDWRERCAAFEGPYGTPAAPRCAATSIPR